MIANEYKPGMLVMDGKRRCRIKEIAKRRCSKGNVHMTVASAGDENAVSTWCMPPNYDPEFQVLIHAD